MLYILIVVYNQLVSTCKTYTTLKGQFTPEITVCIVDNSTKDEIRRENEAFCNSRRMEYHSMGGNEGLSKAYVYAMQMAPAEVEWIMIADQDSQFGHNFMNDMITVANKTDEIAVLLPQVYAGEKSISPIERYCYLNHMKELYGINTGMMINRRVLDTCEHNTELFLDYVDYDFCNQLIRNGIERIAVKTRIDQDFSGNDGSESNQMNRFKIFVRDAKAYSNRWKPESRRTLLELYRHTMKLSLRFRTLRFIKVAKAR